MIKVVGISLAFLLAALPVVSQASEPASQASPPSSPEYVAGYLSGKLSCLCHHATANEHMTAAVYAAVASSVSGASIDLALRGIDYALADPRLCESPKPALASARSRLAQAQSQRLTPSVESILAQAAKAAKQDPGGPGYRP